MEITFMGKCKRGPKVAGNLHNTDDNSSTQSRKVEQKRSPILRKSMERRSRGVSGPGQHALVVWGSCLESPKMHFLQTERSISQVVFFPVFHRILVNCCSVWAERYFLRESKPRAGPKSPTAFGTSFPTLSLQNLQIWEGI